MYKYILILVLPLLLLVGCGETSGDSRGDTNIATTTVDAEGDVTINDVTVESGGTYIQNADGTVTYSSGAGDVTSSAEEAAATAEKAAEDGTYDPTYTRAECTEAGFFYCTLENKCLNQPASGGQCTTGGAIAPSSITTY